MDLSKISTVFMGTPDFAVPALKALCDMQLSVCGVLTQPPRPKGRKQKVQESPVHIWARANNLRVLTPTTLKGEGFEALKELAPQVIVVAAYGKILPREVLELPTYGCINVHASLLPRWRGAAPIHHAILAGDACTGVTLMRMDAGMDTGGMYAKAELELHSASTTPTVTQELATLGGVLLKKHLPRIFSGQLQAAAQPAEGVTYAEKITRDQARLDWSKDAGVLARQVRAFWPHAFFMHGERRVRVLQARLYPLSASTQQPGTLQEALVVQCAQDALCIERVVPEGKREMSASDFLRGQPAMGPGVLLN